MSVEQPNIMLGVVVLLVAVIMVAGTLGGVLVGAVLWDRACRKLSPLPPIPPLRRPIEASDGPIEPPIPEGKRVLI